MKDRRTFTLRLTDELLNRLHYVSKLNKRSVNSEIEFIVEEHIKKFEKENGSIPETAKD